MKYIYLSLALFCSTSLFSQVGQHLKEHTYLVIGGGLGTFAQNQRFQIHTLNIELDGKLFYAKKHVAIGLGFSYNNFPKFKYYDKTIPLAFTNLGLELAFFSGDKKGLILTTGVEYPYDINDSAYFNKIIVVGSEPKSKRNFTPKLGLGFVFGDTRAHQLLLTYKHISYSNEYRYLEEENQLRFYRTDHINIGMLQLTYRLQRQFFETR